MPITSDSQTLTRKVASDLAKSLNPNSVIALVGELGSGKTCFVQGLADGLGIQKKYYVNSPTFTILNIYESGKWPLYHFDWYRLNSEAECLSLGPEEYFDGQGISVVEWGDKFINILPKTTIWVTLEVIDDKRRRITIKR